jgi:hypothetical protein
MKLSSSATVRSGIVGAVCVVLAATGCSSDPVIAQTTKAASAEPPAPVLSSDGRRLSMDSASASRFATVVAVKRDFEATLQLPGRVSATAVASKELGTPLLLFETPELSALYAEYNRARIDLQRTNKIAARLKGLVEAGAAAGKDLDDAEVDAQQADSRVRENEAKLRESGLDPGVLSRLRPGTSLVAADLPEGKLNLVRVGLRATIDFTSFPDTGQRGDVIAVSDAIDPQTRTARMSIIVPNPGNTVRPGMFAGVRVTQRAVPAIAIPRTSLVQADGRTYAFVQRTGKEFERREVMVGPADGTSSAILLGVNAGERVVSGNAILLKGLFFGY